MNYYLYSPTIIATTTAAVGTPVIAQISFGVSISEQAAAAESSTSEECSQDWIEVKKPLPFIGFPMFTNPQINLHSIYQFFKHGFVSYCEKNRIVSKLKYWNLKNVGFHTCIHYKKNCGPY